MTMLLEDLPTELAFPNVFDVELDEILNTVPPDEPDFTFPPPTTEAPPTDPPPTTEEPPTDPPPTDIIEA